MLRERRDVVAHVVARLAREACEVDDVLVRHVAEREVHAARPEPGDPRRQVEALLVVHALDAMQQLVLPARAAEDLERAILEPLRPYRWRLAASHAAADELEPRAFYEGQRCDRAGLEVAVLSDACRVDHAAIELAIAFAGVDHILAGSDYPHMIGSIPKCSPPSAA